MTSDWATMVERQRAQKDDYFAENPRSPIPEDERDAFDGLDYYPIDPDYRYVLPLTEAADPETVIVATTVGGEHEYLCWGEFSFTVDGDPVTLTAYKPDADAERLWVPFRDETNDDTTYGGGRYLDLEYDSHRNDDGEWLLDFNLAYNPTCAYNDDYECPLVPVENWLEVRIEAGEKGFPADPAQPHGHHH